MAVVSEALDKTYDDWIISASEKGSHFTQMAALHMLVEHMRVLVIALLDVDEPGKRIDAWPHIFKRVIESTAQQIARNGMVRPIARKALLVALAYRYWLLATRMPLKVSDLSAFWRAVNVSPCDLAHRIGTLVRSLHLNFNLWRLFIERWSSGFATRAEAAQMLLGHPPGAAVLRMDLGLSEGSGGGITMKNDEHTTSTSTLNLGDSISEVEEKDEDDGDFIVHTASPCITMVSHNEQLVDVPLHVGEHAFRIDRPDNYSDAPASVNVRLISDLFLPKYRAFPGYQTLIRIVTPTTSNERSYINIPWSPMVHVHLTQLTDFETIARNTFYNHLHTMDDRLQLVVGGRLHVQQADIERNQQTPSLRIDHWFHSHKYMASDEVCTSAEEFIQPLLRATDDGTSWYTLVNDECHRNRNRPHLTPIKLRTDTSETMALRNLLYHSTKIDAGQRFTRRRFVEQAVQSGIGSVAECSALLTGDIRRLHVLFESALFESMHPTPPPPLPPQHSPPLPTRRRRGRIIVNDEPPVYTVVLPTFAATYAPRFLQALDQRGSLEGLDKHTYAHRAYVIAMCYRLWCSMMLDAPLTVRSMVALDETFHTAKNIMQNVVKSIAQLHRSQYLHRLYSQTNVHFGFVHVSDIIKYGYLDPSRHPSGSALLRIALEMDERLVGPCVTVRYDVPTEMGMGSTYPIYVDYAIVVESEHLVLRHPNIILGSAQGLINKYIHAVERLNIKFLDELFTRPLETGICRLITPSTALHYIPLEYNATYMEFCRGLLRPQGVFTHKPVTIDFQSKILVNFESEDNNDEDFFVPSYVTGQQ